MAQTAMARWGEETEGAKERVAVVGARVVGVEMEAASMGKGCAAGVVMAWGARARVAATAVAITAVAKVAAAAAATVAEAEPVAYFLV